MLNFKRKSSDVKLLSIIHKLYELTKIVFAYFSKLYSFFYQAFIEERLYIK